MKKTFKKFISALLLMMILFNFTFTNCTPVYAADESDTAQKVINSIVNVMGGVIGIFTWIPRVTAMALGLGVNLLTAQVAYVDGATKNNSASLIITPFDIFFNKVQILDVNFLDVGVGGNTQTIREAVAKWYYIIRLLAIAILLIILLYVGIRMAISSVASDKAVYKHALIDWVVSLALVFVLQYIIMFAVQCNNAIVNALATIYGADANKGVGDAILNIAVNSLGISWESMSSTVVYCIIVFQTLVFLIKYLKRMLTVGFLVIISPLISITYSIDKLGDGKAQALNNWLKEFIANILIQPFHCIMYMAFVDVAMKLLVGGGISPAAGLKDMFDGSSGLAAGVLAIVCILFIDTGEKIIKKIFGLEADSLSPIGMAAAAGVAMGAAKQAPALAQNARKGINFAKQKGSQATSALKNKINTRRDNKAIDKRTKELMSSGQYKTEAGARKRATREVNAQRTLKDMKSSNTSRRNKKIEKQMRKDYGGTDKQWNQFMEKVNNKDPKALEKYNERFAEASKKVPMTSRTGAKIKGAMNKAANSPAGRYVRKMTRSGVGVVVGSMALAAGNPAVAITSGIAAGRAANEFAKTSTGSIATEISEHSQSKYTSREEHKEKFYETAAKGENGDYAEGSKETTKLINELKAALRSIGKEDKAGHLTMQIKRDMMEDPKNFNLNASLTKVLGEDAGNPKVANAAQKYANHTSDGMVYEQIKNAGSMGILPEKLFDQVSSRTKYSDEPKTESAPAPSTDNTNTDTNTDNTSSDSGTNTSDSPEQAEVHQIVENIVRNENTTDIVHNIDEGKIDEVKRAVDDKINELNQVLKKTDISDELRQKTTDEVKRLEAAGNALQLKLNTPADVGGDN